MKNLINQLADEIAVAEQDGDKLELIRLMYKLIDFAHGSIEELLK